MYRVELIEETSYCKEFVRVSIACKRDEDIYINIDKVKHNFDEFLKNGNYYICLRYYNV